jgi:hypothetical protein
VRCFANIVSYHVPFYTLYDRRLYDMTVCMTAFVCYVLLLSNILYVSICWSPCLVRVVCF